MSCETCNDTPAAAAVPKRAFDAVFEQFWPASLPYPMMTPWMGAVVTRSQARAWAIAVGAEADQGVMAGDKQAMLDFVGRAMLGGGVYAGERKKKKKKDAEPCQASCKNAACYACNGCDKVSWYECKDGWCDFKCTWESSSGEGTDLTLIGGLS